MKKKEEKEEKEERRKQRKKNQCSKTRRIEIGGGSEQFTFYDVPINDDNEAFSVFLYNYYSFDQIKKLNFHENCNCAK